MHRVISSSLSSKLSFFGLLYLALALAPATSHGQYYNDNSKAVGGVSIDANGLLSNATVEQLGELSKLRRQAMQKLPEGMASTSETREVSLKGLALVVAECVKANKPLPAAARYLAGLQNIRYVFVYPEQKDIVLVGYGEGWKIDDKGNAVGVKNGRPVMLLDDLVVALSSAKSAARGGITCSIDPTPEGIKRLEQVPVVRNADPKEMAAAFEKAMGLQTITLGGVPETSHFAQVLVAADYRMKRLAMGFDPSPVRGLPSYLQMLTPSRTMQSPRFWLEPKFDALQHDADKLAFELTGSSVKALTEDDHVQGGNVKHTGKANAKAKKWADTMTAKYAELAVADPIFGQLQNCMELAVVGAILARNQLPEKVGNDFAALYDPNSAPSQFSAPKHTPTIASIKGRMVTVSGGVSIQPLTLVEKAKVSEQASANRQKAAFTEAGTWWRN